MNPACTHDDCRDEAARLLPWYVNDTLAEADARHVSAHLEACAICRTDVVALTRVRALLRAPEPVAHTPHAGVRKLLQRIDDAEGGLPSLPDVAPPMPARPRGGRTSVRWLTAAVVLQSVALAVIGVSAFLGRPAADVDARFGTLTSAPEAAPSAALRVVFAPSMTLAEVQDLLRANQLVVLSGPSEAGLFTLAIKPAPARVVGTDDPNAALARLRADPRVRFAEPLGTLAGPR